MMTHPKKQNFTIALIGLFFMLNLGASSLVHGIPVNAIPEVTMTIDSTPTCAGAMTLFTGDSPQTIATWYWEFGDGGTALVQNPSHTYATAGLYQVTLTITDMIANTNSVSHEIQVNANPFSLFGIETPNCAGGQTDFSDYSTTPSGFINTWEWDFGDGSPIETYNFPVPTTITHTYATVGTFEITLTVTTDQGCSNSSIEQVTITPSPIANFSFTSNCTGAPVTFQNQSTPNGSGLIVSKSWNFGDPASGTNNFSTLENPTHLFSSLGNYDVTLIVESSSGCSDTTTQSIIIGAPEVDFIYSPACIGELIQFTVDAVVTYIPNVSSWLWNFGDGSTSNLQDPVHTYDSPGDYDVTLLITTTDGCMGSVTNTVTVNPLPNSQFQFTTPTCQGESIYFVDQSSSSGGYIVKWEWDFGDGTMQTILFPDNPNISHLYLNSAIYAVMLTVTDSDSCQNTVDREVQVVPSPVAEFNWQDACFGTPILFTDLTSSNSGSDLAGWNWDFGDANSGSGNTSTLQNPGHIFSAPSVFTVTLIVTNTAGCDDTISHEVYVDEDLIAGMTFQQVCEPSGQVNFFDETISTGNFISLWYWDFGDGGYSMLINPEHIYVKTDTCYQVSLEVTNFDGCVDVYTEEVCLFGTLEVDFSITTTYAGYPTTFYASYSPEDDLVASYQWNFGDGTPNEITYNETIQHIFVNTGSYQVELSALDTNGCTAFVTHEVFVYSMPIVPIFPDNNAIWNTIGENNILNQNWHFRYGLIGDTLMSATKDTTYIYHKVFSLYDSTLTNPNSTYFGAIRSTPDKKVYVKLPDLPESLLYDFALEVGDTTWFTLGGEMCEELPSFREELHYKVVTAIDSVLLLNYEYRRRWHFAGGTMADTWIEGFGSIEWFGLFNPIISAYTYCGDSYSFACFKEDDVALYVNQPDCEECFCDMLTSIELSGLSSAKLKVYPNPAQNVVRILIDEQTSFNGKLSIYSSLGKIMVSTPVDALGSVIVDVNSWRSGVYVVLIQCKNGSVERATFIVE